MIDTEREKLSHRAVNLGLVANIFLSLIKTIVGIWGHSPALLADGINSTSDVIYYVIVKIFLRLSHKPPDAEHPYGHRQLESIGAVVVGAFVITTAIAIFWNAVNNVYNLWTGQGDFAGATAGALWVALFTIALKVGLTVYTQKVGRQMGNTAVLALAQDHRNDVFSAGAAAIGISLGRMGYPWVDPLAGALVALVILHTGVGILRESSSDLMATTPGQALARHITESLLMISGLKQVEEIRVQRLGPYLLVNVTIGIDGSLTVAAGDKIASQVEHTLYQQIELVRSVHVHYHPARGSHSGKIGAKKPEPGLSRSEPVLRESGGK